MHKESGSKEKRGGVLYFKKPLLVRWGKQKTVAGASAGYEQGNLERVSRRGSGVQVRPESGRIRAALCAWLPARPAWTRIFRLRKRAGEAGWIKLRLFPKEPVQAWWRRFSGSIPPAAIKKVRIYDFYGNENEITFTSQDMGAPVRDSCSPTPRKKA